jgi:hypothetical protein
MATVSGICQNSSIKSTKNESKLILSIEKGMPASENSKDGFISIKVSGQTNAVEIRCMGPNLNIKIADKNELVLKNLVRGEYLVIVRDKSGKVKHSTVELK